VDRLHETWSLGGVEVENRVLLAPLAGIGNWFVRLQAKRYGAGLTVSEMIASQAMIREVRQTLRMASHTPEEFPMAVQLAGCEPDVMGEAARLNEDRGAQIIDINFGCPVKKVVNGHAGSALMRDECHAARILKATVDAVSVPVTLKMRTGWDVATRNGVRVARLAESAGVQALAVHGRTRACRFDGHAEFATVAEIKQSVAIPVIANGDIDSPEKALEVLRATSADAVMVGRAAQGRPWIFREIDARLRGDVTQTEPSLAEQRDMMLAHLRDLHAFYGEGPGVRIARKHVGWYCRDRPQALVFRRAVMQAETAEAQLELVAGYFGDSVRATAA